MKRRYDRSAIGSDVSRNFKQYLTRRCANAIIKALGLNHPGTFSTEVIQALNPVAKIHTRHGTILCVCGHGRLLWRARTFFTEEPQTIEWLDTLTEEDIFWDVGANVGLYSIYAAKFAKCRVLAFEPESQNYSLLVKNIALNEVEKRCLPSNIAVSHASRPGHLNVRYITQGGAYNMFEAAEEPDRRDSMSHMNDNESIWKSDEISPVKQVVYGMSLDDLVLKYDYDPPTHLKIDVDGIESWIIEGSSHLLGLTSLRSILIEINRNSERDLKIPDILMQHGFRLSAERSNWLSRDDRTREHEMPTTNMIFTR